MKLPNIIIAALVALMINGTLNADPAFSVHNRAFAPIFIKIGPKAKLDNAAFQKVDKDAYVEGNINPKEENILVIYNLGKFALATAKFPLNKTIYVSWYDTGLKPQQGTLGLGWKTGKGYSLANNVTQSEIIPVSSR